MTLLFRTIQLSIFSRSPSPSCFFTTRMSSDFANTRAHYRDPSETFDVKDLSSRDPIKEFDKWFQTARNDLRIKEANTMCLSTSTLEGKPSGRMVLLKDFSEEGFTFFTNYGSRKGRELEANPQASLCFFWDALSRQVRVEGKVVKVPRQTSVDYFTKRPANSRVSAYISAQSSVIAGKDELIEAHSRTIDEFDGGNGVPTPDNWGGYLLVPDEIEFWQGNDIRLHDRLRFRKQRSNGDAESSANAVQGENGWIIERLAP